MKTTCRRRIGTVVVTATIALASVAPLRALAQAAAEGSPQRADGLLVYLGVVPAAVVRGHSPSHAESAMHDGAPAGRDDYHLLVAIFDAASGTRVTDASVTARVHGLGHVGQSDVRLEPMTIAGAASFGGFVSLRSPDTYSITIGIARPALAPTQVRFTYRNAPR